MENAKNAQMDMDLTIGVKNVYQKSLTYEHVMKIYQKNNSNLFNQSKK